jgi:superfamily II DNA or RNA helicase
MKRCIIHIKDEINVKLSGLPVEIRRVLEKKLKFFQPSAFHSPAYKLGRWDGCSSFCSIGGATYLSLLDQLLPIIINEGYEIQIQDDRKKYSFTFPIVTEDFHAGKVWPVGHDRAGQPILLRDYQVEAINGFATNLQGVGRITTGAGKTLLTGTMSKMVEGYGRTLVIVPNKDLVKQTYADYVNLGLDVGVYFGDKKEIGKTHTICTWQSLNSLDKRFRDGLDQLSLPEFCEGMIAVIVDEVHGASAAALQQMLSGPLANVPIRWGLTGTIPKEDFKRVGIESVLGPVITNITANELQDAGVLSSCNVNIIQLQDDVAYRSYAEELSYLMTNQKRIEHIAKMVEKIAETGNTLVMIDRIKAGEMLTELVSDSVFVSGKMKSSDRGDHYGEVTALSNKIIFATFQVAAVGINIVNLHNVVLIEPGKSYVRCIQSIGRGLRKGSEKDHVEIYDITSNCKFSKKHLTERKAFYKEAQYPFTVSKVKFK